MFLRRDVLLYDGSLQQPLILKAIRLKTALALAVDKNSTVQCNCFIMEASILYPRELWDIVQSKVPLTCLASNLVLVNKAWREYSLVALKNRAIGNIVALVNMYDEADLNCQLINISSGAFSLILTGFDKNLCVFTNASRRDYFLTGNIDDLGDMQLLISVTALADPYASVKTGSLTCRFEEAAGVMQNTVDTEMESQDDVPSWYNGSSVHGTVDLPHGGHVEFRITSHSPVDWLSSRVYILKALIPWDVVVCQLGAQHESATLHDT